MIESFSFTYLDDFELVSGAPWRSWPSITVACLLTFVVSAFVAGCADSTSTNEDARFAAC